MEEDAGAAQDDVAPARLCEHGGDGGRGADRGEREGKAYGLDPASGEVLWETTIAQNPHAGSLGTLLAQDGRVYIGLSSVEEPLDAMMKKQGKPFEPSFQGKVVALDTRTGRQVWERKLVEGEGEGNGVAVWGSFALDPDSDTLYFTTGNNYTGEATAMSDSVIAVSAETGEMKWHRQATGNDVWTPARPKGPDFDFAQGPQLFVADGRKLVGAGSKSGKFFVYDAGSGEPVWESVVGVGGMGGGMRGEASIMEDRIVAWSNNRFAELPKPPSPAKFPINIKALNPADGVPLWVKADVQPAVSTSEGYLAGGVYFVGSLDGKVRGYDTKDGSPLWTSPQMPSIGAPLWVSGNTLLVGTGVPTKFAGNSDSAGVYAYTAE